MKKILFLLAIILVLTFSGCKQKPINEEPIDQGPVFDSSVDLHTMKVTIDEKEQYSIIGEIEYHANDNLDELYLMMYPNTYSGENPKVSINTLSIDNVDVTSSFTGEDNSAILITLNTPISNGDLVTIQYDMDVIYPDTFRLAHYSGSLYHMYFYPFVAMYDGEFDIDPYSTRGETYYNVLNNYDVTISLDSSFIVSAPGELYSSIDAGDMTEQRYILRNARDFSFSAATYYETYQWTADGIDFEIYSIRELDAIELEDIKEYVRKSFEVYESYIGEYYYDRFVLELGYIYGMESSGIVYCSEEISEGTIVHEIIHQWFFFMIGNDSYNESFLDESLTTYISALYFYDLYGMDGYNGYLDYRDSSKESLEEHWQLYEGSSLLDTPDQMDEGYGFIIYYHGPSLFRQYVLQFLDNDIEEFARILSVYYNEYEGEVATIEEFLTLLEEESSMDGTKEWFYFHLNSLQDVANTP